MFQKTSGREKTFMDRMGGSQFSVKIFMSHSAENLRQGTLLFLRKIMVSKSFTNEKGGVTFFRQKLLVSQCQKNSCVSLQCFTKFGLSKDIMHTWGITIFGLNFFVSQDRNLLIGNF